MPTYYVEDYDGKRNDDAAEPLTLNPVVEDDAPQVKAKVVDAPEKAAPKKTSAARTKSGGK